MLVASPADHGSRAPPSSVSFPTHSLDRPSGAPILLLVLRLAQGFGVGGEWGGAALIVRGVGATEPPRLLRDLCHPDRRLQHGCCLPSERSHRSHPFPQTTQPSSTWGWRIPFLISGLLVFVGLLIRVGLSEPEKFADMKKNDTIAERPVVELFRHERRAVYLTTGMRLSQNAIYYLYTVFGIAYIARSLGTATSVGLELRP